MISPSPNTPMDSATKLSPSAISGRSKVKRGVPVSTSVPTRPSSRPSTIMVKALSSEPEASATEATRPSTISEKYSAGPNCSATLASGGANSARITVATEPGEERAQGGGRQRLAGAALLGHLVAVDRGHHRGGFPGQVDQDRGRRAAILGAVIDAGEHDQRRDRRQREGQRQQHGDGRRAARGPAARRRGAEQAADEGVEQVPGLSAVAKPRPRLSSSSMAGLPYWAGAVAGRRGGPVPAAAAPPATSSRRSATGRSAARAGRSRRTGRRQRIHPWRGANRIAQRRIRSDRRYRANEIARRRSIGAGARGRIPRRCRL